jgi:NarL family two-component system response regulator LiaR
MELTRQEKKMLIALSSGKLYKEIAAENFISINTVKKHLKNVYKKLNVSSRSEAVKKYLQLPNP